MLTKDFNYVISTTDLSDIFGVSREAVRAWCASGVLTAKKDNIGWKICMKDVIQHLQKDRKHATMLWLSFPHRVRNRRLRADLIKELERRKRGDLTNGV